MNPRLQILRATYSWIGRRETSRNQFVGMEKVWNATSYPDGWRNREPYCAAFVCYAVSEAAKATDQLSLPHLPTSPSCKGWQEWAREPKNGVLIFKPDSAVYKPEPGDIVNFLRGDEPNRLSHIGIVEKFDEKTQQVGSVEANTDGSGGRDGDGIYRRWRKLSGCGEFYRIPCKGEIAA